MMGARLLLGLKGVGAFLAGIPWYVFAIAGLAAVLTVSNIRGNRWEQLAVARGETLKTIASAQAKADADAKARNVQTAAAHKANAKEVTNELQKDRALAGGVANDIRVRIQDLERTPGPGALPGTGTGTGGTNAAVDFRLSFSDELALREQCEDVRLTHNALIDWENQRAAIETLRAQ